MANVFTFSTRGKDAGEHRKPMDVAIDREDYVWVVDTLNKRLQKYTARGILLFETDGVGGVAFEEPVAAAVDSSNRVLVLDRKANQIVRLDSNGVLIDRFGSTGTGPGMFMHPEGIAVDSRGRIYIADTQNDRIQVLDSGGNFLFGFDWDGQMKHPSGVSIDPLSGNIMVADTGNNRVVVFDSSGVFIEEFGSQGSGDGEFKQPYEVIAGKDHNMFVSDMLNNRDTWEAFFGNTQYFVTQLPPSGTELFKQPHGMALDSQESILYTADTGNNRIVGIVIKAGVIDAILPNALISAPILNTSVAGVVDVQGIASDANIAQYRLEYGKGENPVNYMPISTSDQPVWGDSLGLWDTRNLVSGVYTIHLIVTDLSGNSSQVSGTVFVEGVDPVILTSLSVFPSSFIPEYGGTAFSYRLSETADIQAMVVEKGTGKRVWISTGNNLKWVSFGEHVLVWDGRDEQGLLVAPGIYSVVLAASNGTISQRKIADLNAMASVESIARNRGGPAGGVSAASSGLLSGAGSPINMDGSGSSGPGVVPSEPDGSTASVPIGSGPSDSGSPSPSGTSSGSHDNGMGNGKNPKDFNRGSNPGNHNRNK